MGEWHREGTDVHTYEYHKGRLRAPHLEQKEHSHRLLAARDLLVEIRDNRPGNHHVPMDVSDLGCGDGGLLYLLKDEPDIEAWGFDFQPSNKIGWEQRGVEAEAMDVFNGNFPYNVELGDVVVLTEVLEHVAEPHLVLKALKEYSQEWAVCRAIVASSPMHERDVMADCHQWAWDWTGYEVLFEQAGWVVQKHISSYWSQLIVAV